MSLETEKVSQPWQFPVLTRAFFLPHIILAELSMQLKEVNQQLGTYSKMVSGLL